MKNILFTLTLFLVLTITAAPAQAQAWERNSKVLSIGIGISQFYHIDDYHQNHRGDLGPGNPKGNKRYSPMTGQFNFQGEFGVHKYVGLGFTTGFGGRAGWSHDYQGEINMPMGFVVNFHFYQLIADKSAKNLHADKLDIYAGANVGSGVAVTFYRDNDQNINSRRIAPLAFGGPHAGIRYYFKPTVGVTAEVGWGKSLVNMGLVFKL